MKGTSRRQERDRDDSRPLGDDPAGESWLGAGLGRAGTGETARPGERDGDGGPTNDPPVSDPAPAEAWVGRGPSFPEAYDRESATLTWLAPMFTWRAGRASLRTWASVRRAERNRAWALSIRRCWNSACRMVISEDWA